MSEEYDEDQKEMLHERIEKLEQQIKGNEVFLGITKSDIIHIIFHFNRLKERVETNEEVLNGHINQHLNSINFKKDITFESLRKIQEKLEGQPSNSDPYHIEKIFTKAVEKKAAGRTQQLIDICGEIYELHKKKGTLAGSPTKEDWEKQFAQTDKEAHKTLMNSCDGHNQREECLICKCGNRIDITVPMYVDRNGYFVCKDCFKKLKDKPLTILANIWLKKNQLITRGKMDAGKSKSSWRLYRSERRGVYKEILLFWKLRTEIKLDLSKKPQEIEFEGKEENK